MKILPLGGASEVGANAFLLHVAGASVLVDAGVRVGSGRASGPAPAYELAGDTVDAMLLTHAHADHTGTLPLVPDRFGSPPIHMTVGTLHLLEVLQGDSLRHVRDEDGSFGQSLAFTDADLARTIAATVPHSFYEPFHPLPGRTDITVEFAPSGHILGAAMFVLDTPDERVLWTGDFSVTPQPTIGAADLDWVERKGRERRIDLLVSEGTYGTSRHPDREHETIRFLDMLQDLLRHGGKVLIPAFAVGRAQDITHTLRQAKLRGMLADVPVYLDGMVRPVTSIYENIAHETYPDLPAPLTLLDPDLHIYKANSSARARLCDPAAPGPSITVSSSGMLIGGASVSYAKSFAAGEHNAILISGYSDEESPARHIQELQRGSLLRLGDEEVRVRCHVGRYYTSAHADGPQVARLIRVANPRKVALVHGERRSLRGLQKRLGRKGVSVLANGQEFVVRGSPPPAAWSAPRVRSPHSGLDVPDLRVGPNPTEPQVRAAWRHLLSLGNRAYCEAEVARLFLGAGYEAQQREVLRRVLSDHRLYLITGSKIGQRSYRPRPEEQVADMLLDRSTAFQVPIDVGDVVIFSDGSPDLFVAAVAQVDGQHIDAIVPFSSRRDFRRDWLRCVTSLSVVDVMRDKPLGYVAKWLEDVVREGRALPKPNALDLYFAALESEPPTFRPIEALPAFYPGRDGYFLNPMHVAAGLEIAANQSLFRQELDGSFQARPIEQVVARWPLFEQVSAVWELPPESPVALDTGITVLTTGHCMPDAFECRMPSGEIRRMSYRHIARAQLRSPLAHTQPLLQTLAG